MVYVGDNTEISYILHMLTLIQTFWVQGIKTDEPSSVRGIVFDLADKRQ
jgi:uncharacterized membrane protein YwzB